VGIFKLGLSSVLKCVLADYCRDIVKKRLYWIAGGVVVAAIAAAMVWGLSSAATVETMRVQKREVVELYVATGRIEARRTSDVGVRIGGTVERVTVDEGDEVKRGDPIVEIRPRDAELAVDQIKARVETLRNELQEIRRGPTDAEIEAARAEVDQFEAQVAQAKRDLKRAKSLHEQEVMTAQQFEEARTAAARAEAQLAQARARLNRLKERPLPEQVRAARARLKQAEVDLEKARDDVAETTVRAPFSGLVLAVSADDGEQLGPNQTVARMADMTTAEIYAEVDEDYFGRIKKGQPATLIFPSMPEKTFEATVRQVGPEISTDRGVVGIHLDPTSLPDNAFPGLTVDVNIEVERIEEALAVPADAVVREPSGTFVLTIEEGRVTRTPIDIRARGEAWMAVDRVEEGTRVIRSAARVEVGDSVAPADEGGGGGTP
jgi:HlyD family secretion protein